MTASIEFTDSIGTASLSNIVNLPSRFNAWTPNRTPIGPEVGNLGTGVITRPLYRTDTTVSLEVNPVQGDSLPVALRLKLHLMKGGTVTLTSDNFLASTLFPQCVIAPGTTPSLKLTDREMLEYTFSCVLKASGSDPCATIDIDDVSPYGCAELVIDFGEYADYAAMFAAISPDWTGMSDYGGDTVTIDDIVPFNSRKTLWYNATTGLYGNHDITPTTRLAIRFWVWFDPAGDAESSEDAFPNDMLKYGRGANSFDNPLDAWLAMTTFTGDYVTSDAQSDTLSGRWIPVLQVEDRIYDSESDTFTQRVRVWNEAAGTKILDVTDSTPQSGTGEITSVNCLFENPSGTEDLSTTRIAFVEYTDLVAHPAAYNIAELLP